MNNFFLVVFGFATIVTIWNTLAINTLFDKLIEIYEMLSEIVEDIKKEEKLFDCKTDNKKLRSIKMTKKQFEEMVELFKKCDEEENENE